MEEIYSEKFTVLNSHVNTYGRMKLSALLGFMQEVAGSHYSMTEQNLIWVISRHHIEIVRLPKVSETIRLETWAMPPTRAAFPRATVGYDADGNEIFRAISLWVLIRKDTRTMVLPGKVNLPMVTTVRGMELPAPNSIGPKQFSRQETRKVYYSLLDVNGHMNNSWYMDWIEDLLPLDFHKDHSAKEFTICYLQEAKYDESVHVGYELENNVLSVEAQNEGQRVFSAQLVYEKEETS